MTHQVAIPMTIEKPLSRRSLDFLSMVRRRVVGRGDGGPSVPPDVPSVLTGTAAAVPAATASPPGSGPLRATL